VRIINTIPLENYLKCVISSEMSAMNDINLLNAHAIISRSWLLAQIFKKKKAKQ
jgi:SpoIID/LytB domain protein